MNLKVNRYILDANDVIELYSNKYESYEPIHLKSDDSDFIIGFNHLVTNEDYLLIEKIINLSKRIKVFIRNENKYENNLKINYPDSVITRNIPIKNYLLDVDIFLPFSNIFNDFLVENKKLFTSSIYSSDTYYCYDCEILFSVKSKYGKLMENVDNAYGICIHQFGDVLPEEKLSELFNTKVKGIEKTILFIKMALDYSSFLKRCCELSFFYINFEKTNKSSTLEINKFIEVLNKSN